MLRMSEEGMEFGEDFSDSEVVEYESVDEEIDLAETEDLAYEELGELSGEASEEENDGESSWEELSEVVSEGANENSEDESWENLSDFTEESQDDINVSESNSLENTWEQLAECPDEIEEDSDDGAKVYTRDKEELYEEGARFTEEILDNYRENLRDLGATDEGKIEDFIREERERLNEALQNDINGDLEHSYDIPENWNEIAENMMQETLEGMDGESLREGFQDIDIENDPERLEQSLESFEDTNWEGYDLSQKKESISELADYVIDQVGFVSPPRIEYYNNEKEGDYGGYDPSSNTLHINEYMLYNSEEAADTVAHELWHAHQYECANYPEKPRDYQYRYNFENYILPELGQEPYENQLVEAEARAFAEQFKDRLREKQGGR